MNCDKARAILEDNFGEFNVDVQALYTLLLAAEERIRTLEAQMEARTEPYTPPELDARIRKAYDSGRSIQDIAIGYFLAERVVRASLARTFKEGL